MLKYLEDSTKVSLRLHVGWSDCPGGACEGGTDCSWHGAGHGHVILNIATQESWKNDKGDYENRTEWHRVYAWRNLSKFAKTLRKGQLITLEGVLRYREVIEDVEGAKFKHRIAEIHAIGMKRLSKVEAADDLTKTILAAALRVFGAVRMSRKTAHAPEV